MKVKELIKKLEKYDGDDELTLTVTALDMIEDSNPC